MKKSVGKVSIITTALSMLLGVPLLVLSNKGVEKVNGISSRSSLPTTIDLKDSTDSEIRTYYSSLNSLTTSERQGTNLLKNLREIIHDDIVYYPYGSISSAGVTQIYTITDRDWENSPATSIVGGIYNANTNKITSYSHSSEKDANPYIKMLYVDYTRNGPTRFLNGTAASFDKEHVWSQSHGFKGDPATGPAGTDLHHLIAGEKSVNQQYHSNWSYGNVKVAEKEAAAGSASTISPNFIISGNKLGTPVNSHSSDEVSKVFEPNDSDKGRIARALLYMAACYNNYSGNETFTSYDPNLQLVDYVIDGGTSVSSSSSSPAKYGILSDLLEWNRTYLPDSFEIHRNNLIYNNYQFNRNPFIDFPEWADYIWGNADSSYQSTGYATPSSDTINGYNSGGSSDPVAVSGVSLDKNSTSIAVGESEFLIATISPINATNQAVSWTSSNTNVATVSSGGRVNGVAEGSATITVTTNDGSFTATCSVTVTESSGSETSAGTISFSRSGTTDTVTNGYTLTVTSASAKSGYYQDKSSSEGLDLDLKKSSGTIWSTSPTTMSLTVNVGGGTTKPNLENNVIAYFLDSNGNIISSSATTITTKVDSTSGQEYTISMPATSNVAGIRIHHTKESGYNVRIFSFSLSYESSSSAKTLDSISLDTSDVQKTFTIGDEFNYDDLVVTANYSDGSSDLVAPTSVSSPNMSSAGQKTVTVTYTESEVTKTATYTITVNTAPKTLSSISVSGQTTSFTAGDTFVFGGTVTATYSDESTSDVTASATFSGYNLSTAGNQTVTVSYGGLTTSYAITVSESQPVEKGTEDNPYTVAEAKAAIDSGVAADLEGKYTRGIISSISEVSTSYGNATYMISDDGSNTNTLTVFRGKNIGNVKFTNTNQITEGDYVVVKGNLTLYNSTTYEYEAGNYLISRTPASTLNQYSLVTSVDSLKTNDEVMFIGYRNGYSTNYSPISYNSTTRALDVNTITVSDNSATYTDTYMKFKIVKNGSNFSFATQDGNYLASKSGDTLYLESSISSNARYSLTLADTGKVTMVVNSLYFRFNYSTNTSSSRMTAYSASGQGTPIYIYKKTAQTEADSWANSFLIGTQDCVTTSWASLASNYSSLSDRAKLEVINCEANSSEDYCLRSQAMARYDYILSDPRFNSGLSTFVTGRSVSPARPNLIPMILSGENSNVAIIIIISLVSVSTVGGYFFLKSRKKEEF